MSKEALEEAEETDSYEEEKTIRSSRRKTSILKTDPEIPRKAPSEIPRKSPSLVKPSPIEEATESRSCKSHQSDRSNTSNKSIISSPKIQQNTDENIISLGSNVSTVIPPAGHGDGKILTSSWYTGLCKTIRPTGEHDDSFVLLWATSLKDRPKLACKRILGWRLLIILLLTIFVSVDIKRDHHDSQCANDTLNATLNTFQKTGLMAREDWWILHLNNIQLVATILFFALGSVNCVLYIKGEQKAKMISAQWVVHTALMGFELPYDFVFWSFLFPEQVAEHCQQLDFFLIFRYSIKTLFLIVDGLLTKIPYRLVHIIYPFMYGLIIWLPFNISTNLLLTLLLLTVGVFFGHFLLFALFYFYGELNRTKKQLEMECITAEDGTEYYQVYVPSELLESEYDENYPLSSMESVSLLSGDASIILTDELSGLTASTKRSPDTDDGRHPSSTDD